MRLYYFVKTFSAAFAHKIDNGRVLNINMLRWLYRDTFVKNGKQNVNTHFQAFTTEQVFKQRLARLQPKYGLMR